MLGSDELIITHNHYAGNQVGQAFLLRAVRFDPYYPGSKEGHIPTRSASEGSDAFPSLARRVSMQQHAKLPCRGNIRVRPCPRFAPSSRPSAGLESIARDRHGLPPQRLPEPPCPIRSGRSMPRSESAWPAANALVGWPSPTRPRGPCWPPRFPPQGRWQNVHPTAIRDMFRRTFTRWGLPEAVRVDNGYP